MNHGTRIKSWLIIDFIGLLILIIMLLIASLFFYQKIKPAPEPNYYFDFIKRHNANLTDKDIRTIINEVNICAAVSGIEIRILYQIIHNESTFNPEALSKDGNDQGLWQIHAPQWGPSNFSIIEDTRKACRILIYEKVRAKGSTYEMLRKYNSSKGGHQYAKNILDAARTIE